jgi:hypothetical protein
MIIETDTSDGGGAEALRHYELNSAYDEMFRAVDHPRRHYRPLHNLLLNLGPGELRRSKQEADQSFSIRESLSRFTKATKVRNGYFLTICCPGSLQQASGKKSSGDSLSGSRR